IARTFQNIRLFEKMTVLENLMVPRQANLEEAKEILGFFTLASYANKPAGELPYGAQRLLEIARALMTKPKLLCLDEPAAGLNPHETEQLNELLLRIRRQFGITILLIEHDMRVVMKISDHIVVLDYGRNIAEGKPATIQSNPIVLKAYLGEDYQGAA
ncbi:MAG: ABC transporter ATP-binding protein, partial [Dongiaceae bacterium]